MGKIKSTKRLSKANSLTDWHLWREVTRSVSPLVRKTSLNKKLLERSNAPVKLSPAEQSQNRHLEALEKRKSKISLKSSWSPVSTPAHRGNFHRLSDQPHLPMMGAKLHRKVRRGQMPIDATIDLHGLHQNEARSALYRFIEARMAQGDRILLIITGKGIKKIGFGQLEQRGVLRHMLPLWLKEPALAPFIAGFETSARQHGGEGAYYVRLKRGKK